MNILYDANKIYEAGTKAIKSAPFKYSAQLYEMNHLLNTAELQQALINKTYKPSKRQEICNESNRGVDIRKSAKSKYWYIIPNRS